MKRLCTICARGGSKGVKKKNIRQLNGKYLMSYSLQQAKESGLFDEIVLSSDSDEILDIGQKLGFDHVLKRPLDLATDDAPKLPSIKHCVSETEQLNNCIYQTIVDLDVSSPLRESNDINEAVNLLENGDAENIITGTPSRRSPYFNLVELDEEGNVHLSKSTDIIVERRQDAPKCFDMNASIYVWKREILMNKNTIFNEKTKLYIMPEERSIDIDSELDFLIVDFLMSNK